MWVIDRSIIIVSKKQPFLDWLHQLPEPDKKVSLEDINSDASCYLLPPYEEQHELEESLEEICDEIFCQEMETWHTEESHWEQDRSLKNFHKWFSYQVCSMPVDLVEGEIEKEEY